MKRRDGPSRRPQREIRKQRFLIVCEGEVTEPEYFEDTRHLLRLLVDLEIIPGGDPKRLVERAVEKKNESAASARKRSDDYLRYDQVWCVFDVDEHGRLRDALQQARDNEISVAVSNPCFELWALLHFQDQNAYIERDKVRELCKKHMPGYRKQLPCSALLPFYKDAQRRSVDLDRRHKADGTEGANPSTGVYKLMEEMRSQPAWERA
jgi:hypothetical protein